MEPFVVDIVISPSKLKNWKININKYVNGNFISSEPSNKDLQELENKAKRTYGRYLRKFITVTGAGEDNENITKNEDLD